MPKVAEEEYRIEAADKQRLSAKVVTPRVCTVEDDSDEVLFTSKEI